MKKLLFFCFAYFLALQVYGQHDDCASATVIPVPDPVANTPTACQFTGYSSGLQIFNFDMAAFTVAAGETLPLMQLYDANPITRTAWFTFELPNDRVLSLNVASDEIDKSHSVGFAVYKASNCAALGTSVFTSNTSNGANFNTPPAKGCERFYVQILATDALVNSALPAGTTAMINFEFDLQPCTPLLGDCMSNPIAFTGSSYEMTETNCFTLETSEPAGGLGCLSLSGAMKSVWYSFNALAISEGRRIIQLRKRNTPFPVAVRVYVNTGTASSPVLTPVAIGGSYCILLEENLPLPSSSYISQLSFCGTRAATQYLFQVLLDRCSSGTLQIEASEMETDKYPYFSQPKDFGDIVGATAAISYTDVASECQPARIFENCNSYDCDGSNVPNIANGTQVIATFGRFSIGGLDNRIVHIYNTSGNSQRFSLFHTSDSINCIPFSRCGVMGGTENYYDLAPGSYTFMGYSAYSTYSFDFSDYHAPSAYIAYSIQVYPPLTPIANRPHLINYSTNVTDNETRDLVTENFNGISDDMSYLPPCTGGCGGSFSKTTFTGFELLSPALVQFFYDKADFCSPNVGADSHPYSRNDSYFKIKLYKDMDLRLASDVALLNSSVPIIDCKDTCAVNLKAGRYSLVLFSDFNNIKKNIYITTSPSCTQPHAFPETAYNLGHNPLNATYTFTNCVCNGCAWESFTVDAGTVNWWRSNENSSRSLYKAIDPYQDPSSITEADLIFIGNHWFPAPVAPNPIITCEYTRFYVRHCMLPKTATFYAGNFTPIDNTGDFFDNPVWVTISGLGSMPSAVIPQVYCHTLSLAPGATGGYREGDVSDVFLYSITDFASEYKSSFFKIRNSTGGNIALGISLSGTATINKYRVLFASGSGSTITGELQGESNGNIGMNVACMPPGYYYIQVITHKEEKGTIVLNTTASSTPSVCVGNCGVSETATWTGGTGSWHTASNWSTGQIPDMKTNIVIPAGSVPTIYTAAFAGNITINGGLEINASLTLNYDWTNNSSTHTNFNGTVIFAGCLTQNLNGTPSKFQNIVVDNPLHVTLNTPIKIRQLLDLKAGNLISNGKLTLLSTPLSPPPSIPTIPMSETAMVVNNGTSEVIGDVIVQRYIESYTTPAGTRPADFGYTYVSNPTTSGTVTSIVGDDLGLVFNSAYKWNCWLYPSPLSSAPFPNIYWYNESLVMGGIDASCNNESKDKFETAWVCADASTPMNPLDGVIINVQSGVTLDATGTLSNGTLSKTITRTNGVSFSGFNLVGNPYPSPLNWDLVYAANSGVVEAGFWRRMATSRYGGTFGYYVAGVPGSGTNDASNEIASMQSFFVRTLEAAAPSANLQLSNSMRPTSYANPRFFRTEKNYFDLMRLQLKGSKFADETTIYFGKNATNDYDENADAWKSQLNSKPSASNPNFFPNLFTQIGDKKIAINGFKELREEHIIPLSFITHESGKHTFSMSFIDGFENVNVYLEDKKLQIIHAITQSSYQFETGLGSDSTRFQIRFLPNKEREYPFSFKLFPNPAKEFVKIQLSKAIDAQITFIDALGRIVYQNNTKVRETECDIKHLPSGLFVVEVRTKEGVKTVKFVKE